MATHPRPHRGLHCRKWSKTANRDPAAEQLHRDRLTMAIVLSIVALILAVIIILAAMSGLPAGSDMI